MTMSEIVGFRSASSCWFRLSVETSPNFPERLLRDRHSLQVGHALEWILGLRDLFHLRVGIKNVNHFSAVLVPLH